MRHKMQQELINQIQSVLAKYDTKALRALIDSIPLRRAAVAAIKREDYNGSYALLELSHAKILAAGGKSWHRLLRSASQTVVEIAITKKEAAKVASRNATFAAKIKKENIIRIDAFEVITDSDEGYCGRWKIITDRGARIIKLDVMSVDFYNVQCTHSRVTLKIQKGI